MAAFQNVAKSVFFCERVGRDTNHAERQQVALTNPSANKRMKQATLRPMVFRQLATDARALVTIYINFILIGVYIMYTSVTSNIAGLMQCV